MILAAAIACLSQLPPAATPAGEDEGWIPLDGVAAIVNDEIVTMAELARETQSLRQQNQVPLTTPEELREFEDQVRMAVVIQRLRAQAGEELGIAAEDVERVVENHLGDRRDRMGLLSYIDDLETRGLGEEEVHSETRRQLYRETWEGSVVGDSVAGQRAHRDRFVRPGEMAYIYGEVRDLFGEPAEVRLHQFSMLPAEGQTDEALRLACQVLRARAEAGEALEAIVRDVGLDRSGVRTWTVTVDRLENDGLRRFASQAPEGTVSEVVLGETEVGTQAAFFVLVDRREGAPPRPFLNGEVQFELSRRALAERDRWHLIRGQLELIETAYIEPPLPLPDPAALGAPGAP